MSIELKGPDEAFAALISVAIGADGAGSFCERDFIFKQLPRLAVFGINDKESFCSLLNTMAARVYQSLPVDGCRVSEDGIDTLATAAAEILDADLRETAFEMVVQLSASDGLVESEKLLIDRLQQGLSIDSEKAREILGSI